MWSDDEVKCLIAVWGDKSIQQQLDGAVRNKEIFENIAKEMRRNGYERDWQQCKTKTKNPKQTYKKIRDGNNKTGQGRKTCKFFDQLDEILAHRPGTVPYAPTLWTKLPLQKPNLAYM